MTSRGALMVLQHMPTDVLLRLPMELGKQRGQPAKQGGFYKHEPLRMGLRTTNPPAVVSAPAAAKSSVADTSALAAEQGGAAAERYGGAASDGWSDPGTNSPSGSPSRPERRQQRGTRTGTLNSSSLSHPRAGPSMTSRLADAKSDIVPRSDGTPASGQRPVTAARRAAQPRANAGQQPMPDKENLRVRPASAAAPAAAARNPARGTSRPPSQPTRPAASALPADAVADAPRGPSLRGPGRVPVRGRPASAEDVVPRPASAPPKRSAPPSTSGARRPAAPSQASVARTGVGGMQQKPDAAKAEAPQRSEDSPEKPPMESSPSALKLAMESPGGSDAMASFKAEAAAAAAKLEALAKKETSSDVAQRKRLVLPDGGRGSGPPTIALAEAPAAAAPAPASPPKRVKNLDAMLDALYTPEPPAPPPPTAKQVAAKLSAVEGGSSSAAPASAAPSVAAVAAAASAAAAASPTTAAAAPAAAPTQPVAGRKRPAVSASGPVKSVARVVSSAAFLDPAAAAAAVATAACASVAAEGDDTPPGAAARAITAEQRRDAKEYMEERRKQRARQQQLERELKREQEERKQQQLQQLLERQAAAREQAAAAARQQRAEEEQKAEEDKEKEKQLEVPRLIQQQQQRQQQQRQRQHQQQAAATDAGTEEDSDVEELQRCASNAAAAVMERDSGVEEVATHAELVVTGFAMSIGELDEEAAAIAGDAPVVPGLVGGEMPVFRAGLAPPLSEAEGKLRREKMAQYGEEVRRRRGMIERRKEMDRKRKEGEERLKRQRREQQEQLKHRQQADQKAAAAAARRRLDLLAAPLHGAAVQERPSRPTRSSPPPGGSAPLPPRAGLARGTHGLVTHLHTPAAVVRRGTRARSEQASKALLTARRVSPTTRPQSAPTAEKGLLFSSSTIRPPVVVASRDTASAARQLNPSKHQAVAPSRIQEVADKNSPASAPPAVREAQIPPASPSASPSALDVDVEPTGHAATQEDLEAAEAAEEAAILKELEAEEARAEAAAAAEADGSATDGLEVETREVARARLDEAVARAQEATLEAKRAMQVALPGEATDPQPEAPPGHLVASGSAGALPLVSPSCHDFSQSFKQQSPPRTASVVEDGAVTGFAMSIGELDEEAAAIAGDAPVVPGLVGGEMPVFRAGLAPPLSEAEGKLRREKMAQYGEEVRRRRGMIERRKEMDRKRKEGEERLKRQRREQQEQLKHRQQADQKAAAAAARRRLDLLAAPLHGAAVQERPSRPTRSSPPPGQRPQRPHSAKGRRHGGLRSSASEPGLTSPSKRAVDGGASGAGAPSLSTSGSAPHLHELQKLAPGSASPSETEAPAAAVLPVQAWVGEKQESPDASPSQPSAMSPSARPTPPSAPRSRPKSGKGGRPVRPSKAQLASAAARVTTTIHAEASGTETEDEETRDETLHGFDEVEPVEPVAASPRRPSLTSLPTELPPSLQPQSLPPPMQRDIEAEEAAEEEAILRELAAEEAAAERIPLANLSGKELAAEPEMVMTSSEEDESQDTCPPPRLPARPGSARVRVDPPGPQGQPNSLSPISPRQFPSASKTSPVSPLLSPLVSPAAAAPSAPPPLLKSLSDPATSPSALVSAEPSGTSRAKAASLPAAQPPGSPPAALIALPLPQLHQSPSPASTRPADQHESEAQPEPLPEPLPEPEKEPQPQSQQEPEPHPQSQPHDVGGIEYPSKKKRKGRKLGSEAVSPSSSVTSSPGAAASAAPSSSFDAPSPTVEDASSGKDALALERLAPTVAAETAGVCMSLGGPTESTPPGSPAQPPSSKELVEEARDDVFAASPAADTTVERAERVTDAVLASLLGELGSLAPADAGLDAAQQAQKLTDTPDAGVCDSGNTSPIGSPEPSEVATSAGSSPAAQASPGAQPRSARVPSESQVDDDELARSLEPSSTSVEPPSLEKEKGDVKAMVSYLRELATAGVHVFTCGELLEADKDLEEHLFSAGKYDALQVPLDNYINMEKAVETFARENGFEVSEDVQIFHKLLLDIFNEALMHEAARAARATPFGGCGFAAGRLTRQDLTEGPSQRGRSQGERISSRRSLIIEAALERFTEWWQLCQGPMDGKPIEVKLAHLLAPDARELENYWNMLPKYQDGIVAEVADRLLAQLIQEVTEKLDPQRPQSPQGP